MLQVHQLRKAYGTQLLFDGVTFALTPGERLGLVGRNGSGKTTLFRLILGEEPADDGRIDNWPDDWNAIRSLLGDRTGTDSSPGLLVRLLWFSPLGSTE